MNRIVKYAVSIILTVAILTMSFSVFATDPVPLPSEVPDSELLWKQAGVEGIYLLLQAWGIDITYGEVEGFTDEVRAQLESWVLEYLQSLPSPMSLYSWVNPWLWSIDFWGNARFNSNMLEDVDLFASWLKTKLGLTDNSTIVINPVYTLGGYTVYDMGTYYSADFSITNPNTINYVGVKCDQNGSSATVLPNYIVAYSETEQKWGYILFSLNSNLPTSINAQIVGLSDTSAELQVTAYGTLRFNVTNNVYWSAVGPVNTYGLSGAPVPSNGNYVTLNYFGYNDIYQFFAQNSNWQLSVEGEMKILTGEMILPTESSDYTPGDSITIIDGQPDYSIIEWDGEVVVSNLPAVVSTGTVENPGIVEFFRPVSALIDMAKTPFEIMVQIIYRFPVEVNVCIMSIMGAVCLIGIIKIMREH